MERMKAAWRPNGTPGYVPRIYDGSGWVLPEELCDRNAFETEEDAEIFMESLGYVSHEVRISEIYAYPEIVFLDSSGEPFLK